MYVASGCGDVSYHWSVPGGWTIISGQGTDTLKVRPDTTDGVVSVIPCNQCGCSNDTILFAVASDTCSPFCLVIGGVNDDIGHAIIQTSDGGYAVAGWTYSFGQGNSDVYVVKLDGMGNLQWTRVIGGAGDDRGLSIVQTSDGGYVIAGWTSSFGQGGSDVYVIKLDGAGNLQWTKTIGGTGNDIGYSVINTLDGGYAIAGYTASFGGGGDVYVIKLDASGNLQWTRTVGGASVEYGRSIIQTTGGDYVVVGWTYSFGQGNADLYVVKLDGSGNLLWTKTIGGASDDYGYSITQTSDGGYTITGITYSFCNAGCPSSFDVYVAKLDSSGNLQWTRTIGGAANDYGSAVMEVSGGGYVISGYTNSFGLGNTDIYVVKLDELGNLKWTRTVGGSDAEAGLSIIQTSDGGYAIAGYTRSIGQGGADVYVVKLDSMGNLQSCPAGCQFSSGGSVNSGGALGSGGTVSSGGGAVGSGGVITSGGNLILICP